MKLALSLVVVVMASFAALACSSGAGAPPDVVARVNGVDITSDQLDRLYNSRVQVGEIGPDAEEVEALKLQLLAEMVDNELMLQRAADQNLTASDAEVDVQYNEFKSQYTNEAFESLLEQQRLTVDDLRREMQLQITVEKLINKEITSKISVSNAEIEQFYNQNTAAFNLPETYRFAHILVTPAPDVGLNNTQGDDATTPTAARDKATRLLRQIQSGQDFAVVATEFSEDPSTAPIGGDLNYQSLDAIAAVDPALADAVVQMRIGETLPRVVQSRFGFHILKLLDRDAGGQKDLTDPRVEAQIRQIIFNRRDQTLKTAYYETIRNQADVQNFFAQRILDRAGQ